MATILVVENNGDIRDIISTFLSNNGFDILKAADFSDALQISNNKQHGVDLILMDWMTPGEFQLNDFLEEVAKTSEVPPILICTGCLRTKKGVEAKFHDKIKCILIKPIDFNDLQVKIGNILSPRAK